LAKKNVFAEKYDEIRSFDGIRKFQVNAVYLLLNLEASYKQCEKEREIKSYSLFCKYWRT
jgi:hypothetical protein